MTRKRTDRSEKTFKIIIIFAILLTLILGGLWFWPRFRPAPPPEPPPPPPVQPTGPPAQPSPPEEPPRPVIRYDKDSADFQELMRRRKAEYGLDKGVDMIVRADESLEIGETVVPMEEILNKIRLKRGEVVESDLGPRTSGADTVERLFHRLRAAENRFRDLEKTLGTPRSETEGAAFQEELREHAELGKTVETYQAYKETLREINQNEDLLKADTLREALQAEIEALEAEKAKLAATLGAGPEGEGRAADDATLFESLKKAEARFLALDQALRAPGASENADALREMIRERAALRELVADYQTYRAIEQKIRQKKALLAQDEDRLRDTLRGRLTALRLKRDDIENTLKSRVMPGEQVEIYGIYVVRPGDNVWNIHFQFLKEYFRNRGITLSSGADEPVRPGVSSGVGKILKFSEQMVHIYNLREKTLGEDLDRIHPLSKIVVFNMGQAFDLLSQVDYENIRHIRFDGETLWIPAQ